MTYTDQHQAKLIEDARRDLRERIGAMSHARWSEFLGATEIVSGEAAGRYGDFRRAMQTLYECLYEMSVEELDREAEDEGKL